MARPRLSISLKLITISTLLMLIVICIFAILDTMKSRKIIDFVAQQLQDEKIAGLRKSGVAQLHLLAEASRIALVESEYATLQSMLINMSRQDERVTAVAVIDRSGRLLAHNNTARVGREASGFLRSAAATDAFMESMDVEVEGQKSIAFAKPVDFRGSHLCVAFIAFSLRPLYEKLQQTKELKQREVRATLLNTIGIGSFAILVSILFSILQGLRITRPIRMLADQANRIASGEIYARATVRARDEVGRLGETFNYMAEQVEMLMEETREKASMEKEIELATAVQSTIIPKSSLVEVQGFSLFGSYRPASECSGDWWASHILPDGRMLVVIGDVTGHGVAPAIMAAVAKGALNHMISLTHITLEAGTLLGALNDALFAAARGKIAMTCCCSIFDPATRTLSTANAGHSFPYRCQPTTGSLSALVVRGKRLGGRKGSQFKVRTDTLDISDILIWYTDGLVESVDADGKEYGGRRFRSLIIRNARQPPKQVLESILEDVTLFHGTAAQADDITLIISKVA